jgi:multiple sugar transport system permease protein
MKIFKTIAYAAVCLLLASAVVFPVLHMLLNSLMVGGHFSFDSYYRILVRAPDYLLKFWNSMILSLAVLLLQIFVSALAAFSLSKCVFRGKRIVFIAFVVLMLLPVQTVLVPNYIVFSHLKLLNTWWPLIVSGAFTPFGAVLMTQAFRAVPGEYIEAAQLEGAGTLRILWELVLPVARGGAISLVLLAFIDAWNMVEQPVAFISDAAQYPLSVFLAYFNQQNLTLSFACGILSLLPGLLLFLYYRDELAEGIEYRGL